MENNKNLKIWLNFVENMAILSFMFLIIYFKEVSNWWMILATFIFILNYNKVYKPEIMITRMEPKENKVILNNLKKENK